MMVCQFFTYIIVSFRWAKLYIDLRVTFEFVPGSVPPPGGWSRGHLPSAALSMDWTSLECYDADYKFLALGVLTHAKGLWVIL